LEADLQLETSVMSYSGSSVSLPRAVSVSSKPKANTSNNSPTGQSCGCKTRSVPQQSEHPHEPGLPHACSCQTTKPAPTDKPDFSRMTQAEKLAYNKAERDRVFG
jgi:hypothetical protein